MVHGGGRGQAQQMVGQHPETDGRYAAPRTPVEEALAQAWAEVLGLEKVGIHDNFFHLGGQSQLLVRLQLKIAKVLKRDIPVTVLFEHPTVDGLSRYLGEGG
jgi:hypothetical protein